MISNGDVFWNGVNIHRASKTDFMLKTKILLKLLIFKNISPVQN